jgi:hypothetical protein
MAWTVISGLSKSQPKVTPKGFSGKGSGISGPEWGNAVEQKNIRKNLSSIVCIVVSSLYLQ